MASRLWDKQCGDDVDDNCRIKNKMTNKEIKKDWGYWILVLILILGLIYLIKILITGAPK